MPFWIRHAAVLCSVPLHAACTGTITFGSSLGDSGSNPVEVGPVDRGVDVGPPPDLGPDVGPEDRPAPDLGPDGGCNERALTPEFPTTWPFEATKTAYKTKFWDGIPGRDTCVISGCHASGFEKPLIPATDAELDNAAKLSQAIQELWETTQLTTQPGSGQVRVITWAHDENGGATIPYFVPAQTNYMQALVDRGTTCALMPIYLEEADAGPHCEAGVCDCVIPTSSVAECL